MKRRNDPSELSFSERHFLGRLAEELSDLIAVQSADVLAQAGIVIPPRSCSLMLALEMHAPASARQLADMLDRSHQLISQKLPKLVKLNLLQCETDPADARRKLYRLTSVGITQIAKFRKLQQPLEGVYENLSIETGEVAEALASAIEALSKRSLLERLERQH